MRRSVFRVSLLVLLAILLVVDVGSGEAIRARVKGIPAVNLREQPNTQSTVVAWLSEGDQVEVRRVSKGWALVKTARGDTGYVGVVYLEMPPGTLRRLPAFEAQQEPVRPPLVALMTTPTMVMTARPTTRPSRVPPTPKATPARTKEPTPTIVSSAKERETVPKEEAAVPQEPGKTALMDIHGDLQTLLKKTGDIEKRLAACETEQRVAPSAQKNSTRTWVLIGIGIIIGGVLGAAYGRWRERNKRTRIRI